MVYCAQATPLPQALDDPYDLTGRELLKCLPLIEWRTRLEVRVNDLQQRVQVLSSSLEEVRMLAQTIDNNRLHSLLGQIASQSKSLSTSALSEYRNEASLSLMLVLTGAPFAWRVLDRVLGTDFFTMDFGPEYPRCDPQALPTTEEDDYYDSEQPCALTEGAYEPGAGRWQQTVATDLGKSPMLYGGVCVLWATFCSWLLYRVVAWKRSRGMGMTTVNAQLDLKIRDLRYLAVFLGAKTLQQSRIDEVGGRTVKVVAWAEPSTFDARWEPRRSCWRNCVHGNLREHAAAVVGMWSHHEGATAKERERRVAGAAAGKRLLDGLRPEHAAGGGAAKLLGKAGKAAPQGKRGSQGKGITRTQPNLATATGVYSAVLTDVLFV